MDSNFWSQNSRISFTAMYSDYDIRRGHSSSPECYPEKFSRSRYGLIKILFIRISLELL